MHSISYSRQRMQDIQALRQGYIKLCSSPAVGKQAIHSFLPRFRQHFSCVNFCSFSAGRQPILLVQIYSRTKRTGLKTSPLSTDMRAGQLPPHLATQCRCQDEWEKKSRDPLLRGLLHSTADHPIIQKTKS